MRALLATWLAVALGLPAARAAEPLPQDIISCEVLPCDLLPSWEARAELLVWWLRSGRLPPLVTTGPAESHGVLGQPGARIVYGDEKIDTNRHLGGKFSLACPLAECWSLCGSFFVVERNSRNFDVKSDGTPLVARPFVDAASGAAAAELLAGPTPQGPRSGGFDGLSKIELFGEQVACRWATAPEAELSIHFGLYLLQMRERLDFTGVSRLAADASLFGETDRFRAHNRFYGVHLGVAGELGHGPWFLEYRGLAAIGATQRQLQARGEGIVQTPLQRDELGHGFLVLASNAGTHGDDVVSFVCEAGVNLGCYLTEGCRLFVGYTLIRWSDVLRAGDQIDTTLDLAQRGGASGERPAVPFREDYFWAMGLNVGVEWRW